MFKEMQTPKLYTIRFEEGLALAETLAGAPGQLTAADYSRRRESYNYVVLLDTELIIREADGARPVFSNSQYITLVEAAGEEGLARYAGLLVTIFTASIEGGHGYAPPLFSAELGDIAYLRNAGFIRRGILAGRLSLEEQNNYFVSPLGAALLHYLENLSAYTLVVEAALEAASVTFFELLAVSPVFSGCPNWESLLYLYQMTDTGRFKWIFPEYLRDYREFQTEVDLHASKDAAFADSYWLRRWPDWFKSLLKVYLADPPPPEPPNPEDDWFNSAEAMQDF